MTNSTGRPSSPPLALMSSFQMSIAISADLPLAASGPVCAMPSPMRIGSAARAGARPSHSAAAITNAALKAENRRISFPQPILVREDSPGRRGLTMRIGVLTVCVALVAAAPAFAGTRPVVVELFTSQGCSSCPPADALLDELSRREGVLALGYHVDYWDDLGWKDPFSSPEATKRQRVYAGRLDGGRIFTPQMVVDGTADMVGSDRENVLAALQDKRQAAAPVAFAADGKTVTIGKGEGSGKVLAVRFVRHRTTKIGAGENARRTAEDANGVVALAVLGEWTGAARDFAIDPPAPGEGVAVLVQAPDGRMLGAGSATSPRPAPKA